jgi:hypothetical protein
LIFLQSKTQILHLRKRLIAIPLQIARNLDNFHSSEFLSDIFRKVFVLIASGVRGFLVSYFGFGTRELAAGGYGYVFCGLVAALRGEVFDFADEGFAGEDFTEDYVLAV